MVRLLPFLLIPVLLIAGLGYWRYSVTQQNLATPQESLSENLSESSALVEVPKTLPGATLEDRVESLEDTITKLVPQVNNLKSTSPQASGSLDSRVGEVEAAVTELKARVSALEKATPAPAAAGSKYPLYITMGAGGGPWNSLDWVTTTEYQISINSGDYSGYSGMQLEVNFRLNEPAGTGSVRLYNLTDGSSVSSQVDTTSTSFGVQTSGTFKLSSGAKTYTLQVKSSEGKNLFIQSARIKVNF